MKTTKLVTLATLGAGALVLSVALRATANDLSAISAYAGSWKTSITHYKTLYSKARTETSTVRNDCWRSAGFYACDQFVNGSSSALVVYTYDSKLDVYHTRIVTPDGSSPGAGGTLLIAGNRWTYPWQDKDGSKTVYIRIINTFLDRNTIRFRQEYSYDRVHWTLTATGLERRQ